uniref:ZAD domain-containing protein n=1 Tax=Anopheles dirus TaxID=7168 RepID=A0A1Y9H360_9DIPT
MLISAPSTNEEDYCHFCFATANVYKIFPLDRPELLSIVDNFIGIQLSRELDEAFSLCKFCIDKLEGIMEYRDACRSHFETVRETRIVQQALKRIIPYLRTSDKACTTDQPVPSVPHANDSQAVNAVTLNQTVLSESTLLGSSPMTDGGRSFNRTDENTLARKRMRHSLDFDADTSDRKIRRQSNQLRHIRVLMNRFRCAMHNTDAHSVISESNVTENSTSLVDNSSLDTNSQIQAPAPACKPCSVVVQKLVIQPTNVSDV